MNWESSEWLLLEPRMGSKVNNLQVPLIRLLETMSSQRRKDIEEKAIFFFLDYLSTHSINGCGQRIFDNSFIRTGKGLTSLEREKERELVCH